MQAMKTQNPCSTDSVDATEAPSTATVASAPTASVEAPITAAVSACAFLGLKCRSPIT